MAIANTHLLFNPRRGDVKVAQARTLLGALAGLNDRYFTSFQFKRMGRFVDGLACKPTAFTARLEAVLMAPPGPGFDALHALEGEVIELVAERWPDLDLSAIRQRHGAYPSGAA